MPHKGYFKSHGFESEEQRKAVMAAMRQRDKGPLGPAYEKWKRHRQAMEAAGKLHPPKKGYWHAFATDLALEAKVKPKEEWAKDIRRQDRDDVDQPLVAAKAKPEPEPVVTWDLKKTLTEAEKPKEPALEQFGAATLAVAEKIAQAKSWNAPAEDVLAEVQQKTGLKLSGSQLDTVYAHLMKKGMAKPHESEMEGWLDAALEEAGLTGWLGFVVGSQDGLAAYAAKLGTAETSWGGSAWALHEHVTSQMNKHWTASKSMGTPALKHVKDFFETSLDWWKAGYPSVSTATDNLKLHMLRPIYSKMAKEGYYFSLSDVTAAIDTYVKQHSPSTQDAADAVTLSAIETLGAHPGMPLDQAGVGVIAHKASQELGKAGLIAAPQAMVQFIKLSAEGFGNAAPKKAYWDTFQKAGTQSLSASTIDAALKQAAAAGHLATGKEIISEFEKWKDSPLAKLAEQAAEMKPATPPKQPTGQDSWQFESSTTPGTFYTVQYDKDGHLWCNCKGWLFSKGAKDEKKCKHTKEVQGILAQAGIGKTIDTATEKAKMAEAEKIALDIVTHKKTKIPTVKAPKPNAETAVLYLGQHEVPHLHTEYLPHKTGAEGLEYAPLILEGKKGAVSVLEIAKELMEWHDAYVKSGKLAPGKKYYGHYSLQADIGHLKQYWKMTEDQILKSGVLVALYADHYEPSSSEIPLKKDHFVSDKLEPMLAEMGEKPFTATASPDKGGHAAAVQAAQNIDQISHSKSGIQSALDVAKKGPPAWLKEMTQHLSMAVEDLNAKACDATSSVEPEQVVESEDPKTGKKVTYKVGNPEVKYNAATGTYLVPKQAVLDAISATESQLAAVEEGLDAIDATDLSAKQKTSLAQKRNAVDEYAKGLKAAKEWLAESPMKFGKFYELTDKEKGLITGVNLKSKQVEEKGSLHHIVNKLHQLAIKAQSEFALAMGTMQLAHTRIAADAGAAADPRVKAMAKGLSTKENAIALKGFRESNALTGYPMAVVSKKDDGKLIMDMQIGAVHTHSIKMEGQGKEANGYYYDSCSTRRNIVAGAIGLTGKKVKTSVTGTQVKFTGPNTPGFWGQIAEQSPKYVDLDLGGLQNNAQRVAMHAIASRSPVSLPPRGTKIVATVSHSKIDDAAKQYYARIAAIEAKTYDQWHDAADDIDRTIAKEHSY